MRKTIPAIVAFAACLWAEPPVSMREAMRAALRNAPQVREYDELVEAAQARSSMAFREVLPSAQVFGSHAETFLGFEPDPGSPASRRNQAGLSIVVPVFQPQGWARSTAASRSRSAARYERLDRRIALSHGAASAWVEYVSIVHRLAIARSRTASSRRSFEGVGIRSASGDLTRIDLRQAESALFSARAAEELLRADSVAAAEALFLLCGSYPAVEAVFPESLLTLAVRSGDVPEGPEVAAARLRSQSAVSEERAELFGCFPTLNLSGSTAYLHDDVLETRRWEHRAELRIALPIPPTGALGVARSARRIAESRHVAAIQDRASRARTAVDGYRRNQYALSLYLSDSAAADEVAVGRETAFQAGSATISEFLSAQKDLFAACDALWLARRNLALAGLALQREDGSLAVEAASEDAR